jgi:hypothetical protein
MQRAKSMAFEHSLENQELGSALVVETEEPVDVMA